MISLTQPKRPRLRTGQAAIYTGLAKSTLEKFRVHGGGCPYVRVGRVVVYDADDLDAWLAAHRRSSTSQAEPSPHPEDVQKAQPQKPRSVSSLHIGEE